MKLRFCDEGIEVEGGLLWLDATRPKTLGLTTHAHGDHIAKHQTILCTPETAELARRRTGRGPRFLEARYGHPTAVGDLEVTLHPAGHVLGSAMAFLKGPHGTLLYTGDVKPEGGLTCPPAEPVKADTLICEATFGREDFRFPPAEKTRAEMVAFARDCLQRDETPVFLAYALGKGQEVLRALGEASVPTQAHGSVWNICDVYRRLGVSFPGSRRLSNKRKKLAAVVVPPRFLRSPEVRAQAPLKVAAVTGWDARAKGVGVDCTFPLSDHADFDGLLSIVDAVAPEKVHVLHGYAKEFAQTLRDRGLDATAVPGHAGPAEGIIPGAFGTALGS